MSLRSPLSEVRGSGSAKDGTHHWWVQRLSGIALIPLTLWFIFSVALMSGADFATISEWAGTPFNATALILLIVASFYHAQLGLQVVVEDYIHGFWHIPMVIAVKLLAIAFAVGGVLAVLKLAL